MKNVFTNKMVLSLVLCLLITLGIASMSLAQDPTSKAKVLDIGTYCDITIAMWQINNDVMSEKIRVIDSLYQMPEQFAAAEEALNASLQAWQDSIMTEYGIEIAQHLGFGKDNKKEINKFLQESGQQAVLDSLYQIQDDLYLTYQGRRKGYNIGTAE